MQVRIRPLEERDLDEADRILRLAFDTFLGFKPPASTFGDADLVRTRWRADPSAAVAAEMDGKLVGSNFATNWGSVGFFGPLSVHPGFWNQRIAQQLLNPTMDLFARWQNRHTGLFTFPHSPKHAALYQKFGFWPRFLTAIMSKAPVKPTAAPRYSLFSEASAAEKRSLITAFAKLTDAIYPGLDVRREIEAVDAQGVGETVLVTGDSKLSGFAACHIGAGTEAGSADCYVKFGAARGAREFDELLDACEALASSRGIPEIDAGVNLGRLEAYQRLIARGFRTSMHGVAMHRANDEGYNHPGVYLLDDWR
jgi:predicted N-acetyltransferase YhbS